MRNSFALKRQGFGENRPRTVFEKAGKSFGTAGSGQAERLCPYGVVLGRRGWIWNPPATDFGGGFGTGWRMERALLLREAGGRGGACIDFMGKFLESRGRNKLSRCGVRGGFRVNADGASRVPAGCGEVSGWTRTEQVVSQQGAGRFLGAAGYPPFGWRRGC